MLGELSDIESLKKMTPELSKSLVAVKDGLKSQYDKEMAEMNS